MAAKGVTRVLVVGGGIAGMAFAIRARARGVAVDLIDQDPDWRVYGAGISLTGPTLRAFGMLGVLDEVLAEGAFGDGIRLCTMAGDEIGVIPLPRVAGADVPANGGIMRPALHRILSRRTTDLGATVRLGIRVETVTEDPDGAEVAFSDGSGGRYDLVVGADGAKSSVRGTIFPGAPSARPTGQGCWRAVTDRPASVDRPTFFLGGPVKAGLVPVSADRMYLFLLNAVQPGSREAEATLHTRLADLLTGFGGPVASVRAGLRRAEDVVYRPLEALLVPAPWHVGRVVLVGDAAHATTPHLASGAGIAVEDALVLDEELAREPDVGAALHAYVARRFDRCRLVVENSVRLGAMEQAGDDPRAQQALMADTQAILAGTI
jgi:2-polyprenyl-6-methoxyphenol hydroxylase-like FAD-dependent oxidoreductase